MIQLTRLLNKAIFFCLLILTASLVHAEVNIKTGNFFLKYTDIILKNDAESFRIDRVYNSKNKKKGWYGIGWSSELESYLEISQSSPIKLYQHGVGPEVLFYPIQKHYQSKIGEKIFKTAKGYKYQSSDSTVLLFNSKGVLEKKVYPSSYELNLNYKNGKLISIKDSRANQMSLKWTSDNIILEVKSSKKKKATYKYLGEKLIQVTNENNDTFNYNYDAISNLVLVKKNKKNETVVTYQNKGLYVATVAKGSDKTSYNYVFDSLKPDKIFNVTRDKNGKKTRFFYEQGARVDGSLYTNKIRITSGKKTLTTYYSPDCELPIKIIFPYGTETSEYNSQCLLTKKTDSRGNSLQIKYDEGSHRVSNVVHNKVKTDYQYDSSNRPVYIKDSSGRSSKLSYDLLGRIKKIEVKTSEKAKKTEMVLNYFDRTDKRFSLSVKGKGSMTASLDDNNEIVIGKKPKEKLGEEVTEAFSVMNSLMNSYKF